MNITEDYVSFEVAKLLKEKRFDIECENLYANGKILKAQGFKCNWNKDESIFANYKDDCSAPTLQMAMKWLREVHNVFISISIMYIDNKPTYLWIPCVIKQGNIDYPTMEEYMADSYEEACEAAIKYCLTNLI